MALADMSAKIVIFWTDPLMEAAKKVLLLMARPLRRGPGGGGKGPGH